MTVDRLLPRWEKWEIRVHWLTTWCSHVSVLCYLILKIWEALGKINFSSASAAMMCFVCMPLYLYTGLDPEQRWWVCWAGQGFLSQLWNCKTARGLQRYATANIERMTLSHLMHAPILYTIVHVDACRKKCIIIILYSESCKELTTAYLWWLCASFW